ncbi:MAG: DUF309 domain-containing protein [Polyangia bacterium]
MPSTSKTPARASSSRLADGREAFNRGDFYLAHEHWEEAWRDARDPDRRLLQGLIQIAAGCHHLREGRRDPGARLISKGAAKLTNTTTPVATPELAALPVAAFLTRIANLLAAATLPDPCSLKL